MRDLAVPSAFIRDALAENGWNVEQVVNSEAWWYREYWHLRSFWSPHCEAFLTFLTDPQDTPRGEPHLWYRDVWAVAASSHIPVGRLDTESGRALVSLKKGWRNRVPELLAYLHSLRGASAV